MGAGEIRATLRGAVYRSDSHALLELLAAEEWPPDALQLIGDGLREAVAAGTRPAAEALARRCVAELRQRDWAGDDELADALEAILSGQNVPGLRPLPVRLADIALAIEGERFTLTGKVDLATGEFRHVIDDASGDSDPEEDDDREWLWVEGQGPHDGYRDMEAFIERLDGTTAADLLGVSIQGRGAFRRFKDTLSRWPDLQEAWLSFSEDRQLGRARAWLASHGHTPARGLA